MHKLIAGETLFKLSNPVKVKSDYEFCKLLKNLQNSVGDKSTSSVDVEASQPDKFVRHKSTVSSLSQGLLCEIASWQKQK